MAGLQHPHVLTLFFACVYVQYCDPSITFITFTHLHFHLLFIRWNKQIFFLPSPNHLVAACCLPTWSCILNNCNPSSCSLNHMYYCLIHLSSLFLLFLFLCISLPFAPCPSPFHPMPLVPSSLLVDCNFPVLRSGWQSLCVQAMNMVSWCFTI